MMMRMCTPYNRANGAHNKNDRGKEGGGGTKAGVVFALLYEEAN